MSARKRARDRGSVKGSEHCPRRNDGGTSRAVGTVVRHASVIPLGAPNHRHCGQFSLMVLREIPRSKISEQTEKRLKRESCSLQLLRKITTFEKRSLFSPRLTLPNEDANAGRMRTPESEAARIQLELERLQGACGHPKSSTQLARVASQGVGAPESPSVRTGGCRKAGGQ